jgi:iron complex outermembrane receptor protein
MRWLVPLILSLGTLAAQTVPPSPPPAPPAKSNQEPEPAKLAPVEVTGSRIKRTDAEGPSPVRIITRDDIETTGRATLTDALREAPEAGFSTVNENGTTAAVRGSTALNLRELGANNTLIIVNGRRVVLTGRDSGGTTFVDLNRFPLAMVERVEVLKDGASAIYGADATAGVVNIILRKDYNGAELSFFYGNSAKTDVAEKSVSFFGGTTAGKASVTVGLSDYNRNALKATDTDFAANADLSARYAAKGPQYAALAAGGYYDLRSGTGPQVRINGVVGTPINGFNGVSIPGAPFGLVITRLPGTGGLPSGALFTATPSFTNPPQTGTGGQFNAALAATFVPQVLTPQSDPSNLYNFQNFVWLTPEVNRRGISTTLRYDVSKNTTAYAEASWQHNQSHIELAPSPITTVDDNQIYIPRTNYWNPFGVDVQFAYRPVDVGPRKSDVTNDTSRILVGTKGTLRERWDWDVGYTYGRDDSSDRSSNMISESRLRAALALTTPDALNVFGGAGFKNDPATLEKIRVTTEQSGYAVLSLGDAKISGDLFELPTGTVGAALYTEWRREKFGEHNDPLSSTLDDIVAQVRLSDPVDVRRTVKSGAAELRIPLVKPAKLPLLYQADLNLAARYETFSDGYNSGAKPYLGLRYQPIRDLVLRGSYTEAFRAPSLPQLYGGIHESLFNNLADLRRPQALTGDPFDGSATQRLVNSTGNPALTPENARTFQYGFVYDVPLKRLKGLSLGATFFHIDQKNVITSLGTSYIRLNEVGGGTADLVVRDPTPEFYINRTGFSIPFLVGPNGAEGLILPGQSIIVPGRIRYFNDRVLNLAEQKVEGYDFEINYTKHSAEYGRFSFRAAATYLSFYGYTQTAALHNQAGEDALPRVRAAGSLVWERKEWRAGVTHSYTGPYGDFIRNVFEVDAYQTTGFFVGYDLPPGRIPWTENTRLTLGVDNAFDRKPPLYDDGVGYDQRFIDRPEGRFWFAGLRKSY